VSRSRRVGCGGGYVQGSEVWAIERRRIYGSVTRSPSPTPHSDGGGRYLCPLCLEWFADLNGLSLEHAPPVSVGGRHMAVTCRACNSTAGATVDAALRWAETVRDFGLRRMTKSMPATFRFAGIEQRVEATFGQDGLSIAGVPRQNHPETAQAVMAAFDKVVADGPDRCHHESFVCDSRSTLGVGGLASCRLSHRLRDPGISVHPPPGARAGSPADPGSASHHPRPLLRDDQAGRERPPHHVRPTAC
jgi:HNH endonuclease